MGKRIDREGQIQRSIVAWLKLVLPPECIVHACANESHLSGRAAMLATVKKKSAGQVTGFPDLLVLPFASAGALFLEVKAKGGRLSEAQKDVHSALRRLGYPVVVVRSIDDAREALIALGVGFREPGRITSAEVGE